MSDDSNYIATIVSGGKATVDKKERLKRFLGEEAPELEDLEGRTVTLWTDDGEEFEVRFRDANRPGVLRLTPNHNEDE